MPVYESAILKHIMLQAVRCAFLVAFVAVAWVGSCIRKSIEFKI
jgi:hypothetical protein